MIRIMAKAGVAFNNHPDVDDSEWVATYWSRLLDLDELIKDPPVSLAESLELVRAINERVDLLQHLRGHPPL